MGRDVTGVMRWYTAGVVALLCCTALFVGGIAASDAGYEIGVDGSVDTPDRQVTLEGDEYTVSAIGVVSPGEPIDVSVDAPTNASYDIYLYNEDRRAEDIITDAGSSETFDGEYSAGSYLLAIWEDGNVRTVHPVVVSSYDVSLDTPSDAESGSDVQFTVDVENVPDTPENLNSVQVVVSKNGNDETLTATEASNGTYTVTTTLSETGDYLVYSNVRGSDTVNGQKELLGVSESNTVTVRDPTPTPTSTPTDTDSGGDPPADDTPTATTTVTPTTGTSTATTTPMDTTQSPTPNETTATPESTATPDEATATASATPTSSNVLTPNEDSPTETTGSLSVLVPLLALVGFGLFVRRQ